MASAAAELSSYGLYAIVSVLGMAVVYLYRKVMELNTKIQNLQSEFYSKSQDLTIEVTKALLENSKALDNLVATIEKRFNTQ